MFIMLKQSKEFAIDVGINVGFPASQLSLIYPHILLLECFLDALDIHNAAFHTIF